MIEYLVHRYQELRSLRDIIRELSNDPDLAEKVATDGRVTEMFRRLETGQ